ncbi:aromatic compound dioxygenase [Penicillium tannophilum]|nr:aromatic compound dioxygenase [Penicillium tannophilum]
MFLVQGNNIDSQLPLYRDSLSLIVLGVFFSMQISISIIVLAAVGLATVALTHPGHNEVKRSNLGVQQFKAQEFVENFEDCAAKREASGLNARAEASPQSHPGDDESVVFSDSGTCVLNPEVSSGNGNTADTDNLDKIFLRGIQETNSDRVTTFQDRSVPHIGQLFWDRSLISIVEATSPYSINTIELTTNAEDRVFATETEDSTSDPVFEYVSGR